MKKLILLIAVIIVVVPALTLTGCIRRGLSEESGPLTTRSYDFTGFTGIKIGNALNLELTYDESYSVTITAGENLFDHIEVTRSGDMLKIYTKGWWFNWWWGHNTPRVTITMPVLERLYLSGASEGTVTGFKSAKDLSLKASGASHLQTDIEAGFLTAEVSGASGIEGTMASSGSDISLSGASEIDLTGRAAGTSNWRRPGQARQACGILRWAMRMWTSAGQATGA